MTLIKIQQLCVGQVGNTAGLTTAVEVVVVVGKSALEMPCHSWLTGEDIAPFISLKTTPLYSSFELGLPFSLNSTRWPSLRKIQRVQA